MDSHFLEMYIEKLTDIMNRLNKENALNETGRRPTDNKRQLLRAAASIGDSMIDEAIDNWRKTGNTTYFDDISAILNDMVEYNG